MEVTMDHSGIRWACQWPLCWYRCLGAFVALQIVQCDSCSLRASASFASCTLALAVGFLIFAHNSPTMAPFSQIILNRRYLCFSLSRKVIFTLYKYSTRKYSALSGTFWVTSLATCSSVVRAYVAGEILVVLLGKLFVRLTYLPSPRFPKPCFSWWLELEDVRNSRLFYQQFKLYISIIHMH